VNANPVFVKRILVKLSKAKLAKTTVGKSGGYDLARSPKSISLLDIYSAVNPSQCFRIHTYPKSKGCVVSCNIKEVMSDVLVGHSGGRRQGSQADDIGRRGVQN